MVAARGGGETMKQGGVSRLRAFVRRADAIEGVALVALGGVIAAGAFGLRIGTPAHMGPGFVPLSLGVLLLLCGVVLLARGKSDVVPASAPPAWRPLLALTFAFLLFAVLVDEAGLAIAVLAAIPVAGIAGGGARLRESLVYAVAMAAFAILLFVEALKLPLKVWPWAS